MCTSITMTTDEQDVLLARTMDFGVVLEAEPTFIPRKSLFLIMMTVIIIKMTMPS